MELKDGVTDVYGNTTAFYYAVLLTINVTLTAMMLMVACLWCKRQATKDDLGGLEGMVKMTNPDDIVVVKVAPSSESHTDLTVSGISNTDSEKRASTAAHRSLPDIPVVDGNGDNGSELYETVADKRLLEEGNERNISPTPSLKKQTSVSQHSSISQADDVSSPYSRVRNPPHDYAKVRNTEHPYAQVNPPSTSAAAAAAAVVAAGNTNNAIYGSQPPQVNGRNSRNSNHSNASQNLNDSSPQVEIPAASAIAGMISASQDLPYMTPPITNQHFSGDSQDSSKGYTSISVREPLANILAQQPPKQTQRLATLIRDASDSHYATVSDDSDETYAAIEDPNMRNNSNMLTDIYTSGSETYAQIQPMQMNSMVVSVEINNVSNNSCTHPNANASHANNAQTVEHNIPSSSHHHSGHNQMRPNSDHATPIPPPVDSLRTAQKHSRQPSSSSNNSSSICNLGSPKPEKRQANSPLPPTPKSNITSGRSSVISVIECGGGVGELNLGSVLTAVTNTTTPASTATCTNTVDGSPQKTKCKSLSPSKDIEGMYAKVMKKNKLSHHSPSSQNNSPVMTRKYVDHTTLLGASPLDIAAAELMEMNRGNAFTMQNSTAEKSRIRSNSYGAKDHGYETIPADGLHRTTALENRKSDCYSSFMQKERPKEILQITNPPAAEIKPPIDSDVNSDKHYETIAVPLDTTNNSDPGYETLRKQTKLMNQSDPDNEKKSSDYDPNYEVLEGPKSAGLSDDGYAKINEKKRLDIDEDSTDGYSKVKGEDGATGGYSTIATDANHNYASIAETKQEMSGITPDTEESDHYARIAEAPRIPQSSSELPLSVMHQPTVKLTDNLSVLSTGTQDTLAITSPSSISSSLLGNSSTLSSTNALTGSSSTTSTMSSRQTPSTSSQYESLTGSETDPNYESVCYTNTERENPYERLQTEYTDTQLSSSSPITPDELNPQQQKHAHSINPQAKLIDGNSTSLSSASTTGANSDAVPATTTIETVLSKITPTANGLVTTSHAKSEKAMNKVQNASELIATADVVVVDDYFQV